MRVFLAIERMERIEYLQEEGSKNKRIIRSLVEERGKKERLFGLILY